MRRRLQDVGLRTYRPYRGSVLTERNKQSRLDWARQHLNWRLRNWNQVVFTDESIIKIAVPDNRLRVVRQRGERYNANCIAEYDRWGRTQVHVWAGITHDHIIGPIVLRPGGLTARRYIDDILTPHALPYLRQNRNLIFQQDNAPAHTARATRVFFNAQGIRLLPHPAQSPDLNPIEHYWDRLKTLIRDETPQPANRDQLIRAVHRSAALIPQHYINTLISSMYRRCQAVLNANGGHTEY